jgi:FkbM family methyltransferase
MDIPALLAPLPLWLRRHKLVIALLRCFPDSHDQWITFNGSARVFVDLREPEMRNVFLKRKFEPDFIALARTILAEGGTYLDGGANFGLCTFGLLTDRLGEGLSCHLFEANPDLISYLETSQRGHPSVWLRIVHGCLSDSSGQSRFEPVGAYTGSFHVAEKGEVIVPNVVLEEYLFQNKITNITLMKLDLEGQELPALRGLGQRLARGDVETVYLEIASTLLRRYGLTPKHVIEFLYSNAFRVFYCRDRDLIHRRPAPVRFRRSHLNRLRLAEFELQSTELHTDLLAIRRELFES